MIEEPVIFMIGPSSSCPDEQLALVPDRVECLQQFSQPILSETGIQVNDHLRFFVMINPPNNLKEAHSLVATTSVEAVVALALQCKRRTLVTCSSCRQIWKFSWMLKTAGWVAC